MSAGSSAFTIAYQACPIILTGQPLAGGSIPILALTSSNLFPTGLLGGGEDINPDDYFAQFVPMPGATLIDQDIATYPFANQAVAANAVITKPLTVSILMICPVREPGGYFQKSSIMQGLQATLAQHNASGGTYTVATPSFVYTDCVMIALRSLPDGESKQTQLYWQFDFMKPLLTLDQAAGAYNNLMSRIAGQTQIQGPPTWSGIPPTVGRTQSGAFPNLIPAGTGTIASSGGQSGTP